MSQPSLFGEPGGGSAVAHIDGGSRGNPGPAGYGVHIERADGTVVQLKKPVGVATNNVAEYHGLLAALTWATRHGVDQLHAASLQPCMAQRAGLTRTSSPSGRRISAPKGSLLNNAFCPMVFMAINPMCDISQA